MSTPLQVFLALIVSGAPDCFVLLKPSPMLLPAVGITTDAGTDHPACCKTGDRTIAASFIAEDGDFIEIETLGLPPNGELHCGSTFFDDPWFDHQLLSYRIRVRVRRSDVATVLRRALHTPEAEVPAGVAVEASDGGLAFGLYGTTREFVLPAPASAAGLTYSPERWTPVVGVKPGRRVLRLLTGLTAPIGDGGSVSLLPGEVWPRSAARRRGAEFILPVSSRCARLEARVPASALLELDAGVEVYGLTTHMCGGLSQTRVRAGAPVFWPDGRVAGVTTAEDGVPQAQWAGDGGTTCANITLQGVEGSLPLCFLPADLHPLRLR